ncbi:hypothetical protein CFP56_004673 [Quercus suber]|uniref:Uncharacterized protein n=1 Tax=Quercus suber TaxID=58331 RepID=A0AAW0LBX1_QUESU
MHTKEEYQQRNLQPWLQHFGDFSSDEPWYTGCKSVLFEGDAKVVIDALISSPSLAQQAGPFERSLCGRGDEVDVVLSDVEEGDEPVPISIKSPSAENVLVERFRELLAKLDRERQAR